MQKYIHRYRYSYILLKQLVKTDFKLRYQGSILGYVWSLLRPLALFAILYLVFGKVFRAGDAIPYFPVYLLIGIVVWNYFLEVTTGSVSAIVSRGDLIRKINFPKYVIVLAGSFSALINLLINSVVITFFMVINHVPLQGKIIILPILIAELFIFSLAIAFFLSAAYVRFRDINYIWEVIIQGAFYATPILYPLTFVTDRSVIAGKIMMLNPMAQIIQDIRYVVVTPQTVTIGRLFETPLIRLFPFVLAVLLVVGAVIFFKRQSKSFAEEV